MPSNEDDVTANSLLITHCKCIWHDGKEARAQLRFRFKCIWRIQVVFALSADGTHNLRLRTTNKLREARVYTINNYMHAHGAWGMADVHVTQIDH